jgi:hypothetical protein
VAIAFTHKIGNSDSTVQTTYTTASVTPATDGSPLVLLIGICRATGSVPSGLSSVTGNGLTWSLVTGGTSHDAGTTSLKLGIAVGVGTASNGTIAATLTGNSTTGVVWQVLQISGCHLTLPFGTVGTTKNAIQSTSDAAATSFSLTLPNTVNASSAVLGGVVHVAAQEDITAGTDFTRGTSINMATPNGAMNYEYKTANLNTTFDASWATSGGYNAYAFEVFAPDSAPPVGFIPI